jgi:hypothetical protein
MHVLIVISYLDYKTAQDFFNSKDVKDYLTWTKEKETDSKGKNHNCFGGIWRFIELFNQCN